MDVSLQKLGFSKEINSQNVNSTIIKGSKSTDYVKKKKSKQF